MFHAVILVVRLVCRNPMICTRRVLLFSGLDKASDVASHSTERKWRPGGLFSGRASRNEALAAFNASTHGDDDEEEDDVVVLT